MSVIFLFVVPWDYVWRNFVAARSDRSAVNFLLSASRGPLGLAVD